MGRRPDRPRRRPLPLRSSSSTIASPRHAYLEADQVEHVSTCCSNHSSTPTLIPTTLSRHLLIRKTLFMLIFFLIRTRVSSWSWYAVRRGGDPISDKPSECPRWRRGDAALSHGVWAERGGSPHKTSIDPPRVPLASTSTPAARSTPGRRSRPNRRRRWRGSRR